VRASDCGLARAQQVVVRGDGAVNGMDMLSASKSLQYLNMERIKVEEMQVGTTT